MQGMERAEKCVAKYLKAAGKAHQPVAMPDSHKRAAAVALIISNHEALLEDWGLKNMGESARRSLRDAKGSWEKLSLFLNGGGRGLHKPAVKIGKQEGGPTDAPAAASQSCIDKGTQMMRGRNLALHAVLTSPDAYSRKEAPKCVAKYLKAAGKLEQPVCIPDSHKRAAAVALNLIDDWGSEPEW